MDFYNIIFIEGVPKIGKTTQCAMLKNYLLSRSREVEVTHMDHFCTPKELVNKINNIRNWCIQNPNKTMIVSGSIAYSIVLNDIAICKYGTSYSLYDDAIKSTMGLIKDLKVKNILMNSGSYDFLLNRDSSLNIIEIGAIYIGLEYFATSQISHFKWDLVNIKPNDSIITIHTKIKKVIYGSDDLSIN